MKCEICVRTNGHAKDCTYFPDWADEEIVRLRASLSKAEQIATDADAYRPLYEKAEADREALRGMARKWEWRYVQTRDYEGRQCMLCLQVPPTSHEYFGDRRGHKSDCLFAALSAPHPSPEAADDPKPEACHICRQPHVFGIACPPALRAWSEELGGFDDPRHSANAEAILAEVERLRKQRADALEAFYYGDVEALRVALGGGE